LNYNLNIGLSNLNCRKKNLWPWAGKARKKIKRKEVKTVFQRVKEMVTLGITFLETPMEKLNDLWIRKGEVVKMGMLLATKYRVEIGFNNKSERFFLKVEDSQERSDLSDLKDGEIQEMLKWLDYEAGMTYTITLKGADDVREIEIQPAGKPQIPISYGDSTEWFEKEDPNLWEELRKVLSSKRLIVLIQPDRFYHYLWP
jgi:hypothetical protein